MRVGLSSPRCAGGRPEWVTAEDAIKTLAVSDAARIGAAEGRSNFVEHGL